MADIDVTFGRNLAARKPTARRRGALTVDRCAPAITPGVADPPKPVWARVLYGIAAAILIVGVFLVLFVGGPGQLVVLAGAVVFFAVVLAERMQR